MKIRVRVRQIPERVANKTLQDNNYVIMDRAKRGKTVGWKFQVTPNSMIPIKKSFWRLGYAVEVYPQAQKAIEFPSEPTDKIDPPRLTAHEAAQINATEGFRRRYGDKAQGGGSNWIMYVILILGIISLILLLRGQGVVRF
jgi:hypothetical protein